MRRTCPQRGTSPAAAAAIVTAVTPNGSCASRRATLGFWITHDSCLAGGRSWSIIHRH
ncbi:hypothetical protein HMPREF3196_01947 [Bifidobacterium bifidum]|uniref:Uncharacterized protein n=1 Tax=Bifidobacterium bifidum TaxID=1681 RepID=A0A133KKV4_BIFBI|nr:hypothetical protein HMPREF3196_01947 [Bifidobacterium bifidum]